MGIWEHLNNPDFKPIEFDVFRRQAGLNSFVLTAKEWIEKTGAIGLVSKSGNLVDSAIYKRAKIKLIKIIPLRPRRSLRLMKYSGSNLCLLN